MVSWFTNRKKNPLKYCMPSFLLRKLIFFLTKKKNFKKKAFWDEQDDFGRVCCCGADPNKEIRRGEARHIHCQTRWAACTQKLHRLNYAEQRTWCELLGDVNCSALNYAARQLDERKDSSVATDGRCSARMGAFEKLQSTHSGGKGEIDIFDSWVDKIDWNGRTLAIMLWKR